jgi:phage terminase small subunit
MVEMTEKQKAFCDYYIETANATEAARLAGYKGKNLNRMACENMTKPYIREYIEQRLKQMENKRIADAKEVLEYLTKVMRGEEKDQFGLDAPLSERTKAAELIGKRYALFKDNVSIDANVGVSIIDDIQEEE